MAQPKEKQQPPVDDAPRRRKPKASSNIISPDLTPMIDVTFQLLVYFLVTSAFIPDEGQIPGSLPRTHSSNTPPPPVQPVKLTVEMAGVTGTKARYTISGRSVTDPKELYRSLRSRFKSEKQPLLIKVLPRCKWQFVVEAFNQGVRAKFKNIGFKS